METFTRKLGRRRKPIPYSAGRHTRGREKETLKEVEKRKEDSFSGKKAVALLMKRNRFTDELLGYTLKPFQSVLIFAGLQKDKLTADLSTSDSRHELDVEVSSSLPTCEEISRWAFKVWHRNKATKDNLAVVFVGAQNIYRECGRTLPALIEKCRNLSITPFFLLNDNWQDFVEFLRDDVIKADTAAFNLDRVLDDGCLKEMLKKIPFANDGFIKKITALAAEFELKRNKCGCGAELDKTIILYRIRQEGTFSIVFSNLRHPKETQNGDF